MTLGSTSCDKKTKTQTKLSLRQLPGPRVSHEVSPGSFQPWSQPGTLSPPAGVPASTTQGHFSPGEGGSCWGAVRLQVEDTPTEKTPGLPPEPPLPIPGPPSPLSPGGSHSQGGGHGKD